MGENKDSDHLLKPFVSVIVPVFNSPERAAKCIEALLDQTYPKERYEIIVVDNGSTDHTPQVIQRYPVTFMVEDRFQSPYIARNLGIQHAKGQIIALIDINCFAISRWIEKGVESLENQEADLCGGKVTFTFSEKMTYGEIFDSISNVKMKSSIEGRGVAKGGNLFIRKQLFEAIGYFPSTLRSGGDVLWTGNATRKGFKLVYSEEAEVNYPARTLIPLLKKSYRVGKGQPEIWKTEGISTFTIYKKILSGFRPPSFSFIRRNLEIRGPEKHKINWLLIWVIAWCCSVANNLGRFHFIARRVRQHPLE